MAGGFMLAVQRRAVTLESYLWRVYRAEPMAGYRFSVEERFVLDRRVLFEERMPDDWTLLVFI